MMGTDQPRASTVVLLLSFALVSGGCGQRHDETNRLVGPTRVITAQNLPLKDGNGAEVGSVFVATSRARILNVPRLNISAVAENGFRGRTVLECTLFDEFSNSGQHLRIEVGPESAFTRVDGDRAYPPARRKTQVSTDVFSGKPVYALRDVVPTEDVRLADADGKTFAVLGLSVAGEPSIAFIDESERLQAVWSVGRIGNQTVKLFDRHGDLRVLLTLLPGKRPNLNIYNPPYVDVSVLNSEGTEEIPMRSLADDELTWLSAATPAITTPIALLDQRDALIWKSR
jgi:hypothetical protein